MNPKKESTLEIYNEALATLAWSLWVELGVSGNVRNHQECLIAIEELILLTSVISEYDPRLFQEAIDWCARNHNLISITRLKTLINSLGGSIATSFSVFSATLNHLVPSKWPMFAKVVPKKVALTGKSQKPDFSKPALLNLRLRNLFGVGVRADLITCLLTQSKSKFVASDVTEIGYSKRSFAELLDQLVQSGLLASSLQKNQRVYEVVKLGPLRSMVGETPKIVPPWRTILELVVSMEEIFVKTEKYSQSSREVVLYNQLKKDRMLSENVPKEKTEEWFLKKVESYKMGYFGNEFVVENPFETITFSVMQAIDKIVDCVDGVEFILNDTKFECDKHEKIFKEVYLLFLNFLNELLRALKEFKNFPLHRFNDSQLSEIHYHFFLSTFGEFEQYLQKLSNLSRIVSPVAAKMQYSIVERELDKIHLFINKFKQRLSQIYSSHTDVHLLTAPDKLYKRHLVMKLFED